VSTRGKKREGFQCKIVNGFHVTVMILMDSGLNDAYPKKGSTLYILSTTQSIISGNLCYLLTSKSISRMPDSERYSNKETIQNKKKTKKNTQLGKKKKQMKRTKTRST
jgi:hypothetical protein